MVVYVGFMYAPFNPRKVVFSLILMIVRVVIQFPFPTPGNPMPWKECELTLVCSVDKAFVLSWPTITYYGY
ncbi:hypothetical protein Hanom_Chr04g00360511 [Helianthus anomalus]